MKVLVHFQINPKNDIFEGARLRKTIKSALEMNNAPYANTSMDDFDIAHFVYVESDNIIDELKERHIPIVVSALYCENDPCASYLEYKYKNGERSYSLKSKAIRFLEKANLILVPNDAAKNILEASGINNRIEICPLGVNLTRFDFSRDDEKDIFYRYFSCNKENKVVVAIGNAYLEGLSTIATVANLCQDTHFYYFYKPEKAKLNKEDKKILKNLPNNLIISNLVADDIYRSALINADMCLLLTYRPVGTITILEAMAAKCQLVVREQELLKEIAVDQKTAYVANYSETLVEIIKEYLEGKLKPTINEAYKIVRQNDINAFGKRLLDIYQSLIK